MTNRSSVVEILIIVSFFFFLSLAEWVSAKVIRAGIIGQIAVGIIFGAPLANILEHKWQETFMALGYVGLILIIFEGLYRYNRSVASRLLMLTSPLGGLSTRLDLLKQNLVLSTIGAATGVCFPIGLSYLLLYLGYGYGKGLLVMYSTAQTYVIRPCRDLYYWRSPICYVFR